MFNPFYEYVSPDQGYYTQQPATVDQVNNIWLFVQKMRRELSRAILEFNKYPDRQDEITQNVQSITDQLKLVQQQLEKLNGVDEKAAAALDELKSNLQETLEAQNKLIGERLKDVSIITPENGSVLPVKKITGTGDVYTKQINFTSTEDKSAIDTGITGSEDVVNITQSVPGLLSENLAPRFTVENTEDGFTTKIDDKPILNLEAESLEGDLVVPHIENVDENEYRFTVSSDGVESEIARVDEDIAETRHHALDKNIKLLPVAPVEENEDFGCKLAIKGIDDEEYRYLRFLITSNDLLNMVLDANPPKSDLVSLSLKPVDQFDLAYPDHQESYTSIDGATITTSERTFAYDKDDYKLKISEPFNTKKIMFTTTPDGKHSSYFEVDQAGNVTINTASIDNKIEKNATAATTRMDALQARLVELEEKVRRLETRAVNQITSSKIRVEPQQGDKLAIILENFYANGKHEEKQAVINFTSQDGALVFHTRDQGITGQAEMFINMSNDWLEKQGLKSTTNA